MQMSDETQPSPADDSEYQEFLAFKNQKAAKAEADKPKEYYVHMADGNVVTLSQEESDATGSHYDGIAVVNRYQVGA
jgi:hypothetical protein